ncbi:peptidylprolyl isomerase [Motiliproteus sp. MSK22-1]|uniref:FKBP-type peptidyl-prolyl cis-trans isomerase n=1 Tax=Motiliproteus sp. MSK22-1 TaxID=1897630 RepID=UPI000977120F|nr:peptidylprolyl isomerase [Motiliproteus sp. MSK22-1]OMH25878.1 peptidylprolyl isomerase [Motiliproteus sp. MSK22-1]
MIIEKNKVVSFHYRIKDENGNEVERSDENQPALYLHGHAGMLEGIVNAMEGRSSGESFQITLPPEQAYGDRHEDAKGRIPVKQIRLPGQKPVKGRLQPGTQIEVSTKEGIRQATVIKMGLKSVDIDANHPLAGKTLDFEIDIVDVRDATEEETAHGHAHGAGGHQH